MSFVRSIVTRAAAPVANASASGSAARHVATSPALRAFSTSSSASIASSSSLRLYRATSTRSSALSAASSSRRRPAISALRSSPATPAIRSLSTETRAKLDKVTKSATVVVFMKGTPDMPMCGFSRAVVQILDVQGVNMHKLTSINVLEDEELRQGIKEYSDWPTIPQVYIGGEFVGGCDILMSMHQSGELEDLLVKHKIITDGPDFSRPTSTSSSKS